MALKRKYETREDIPEGQEELYTEAADGTWQLDLESEGDTSNLRSALQKERDGHKKALQELRAIQEKYKDLDPEAIKSSLEKLDQLETERLSADERQTKEFERERKRFEQRIAQLEQAAQEERQRRDAIRQRYAKVSIQDQLAKAALEAGTDPKKLGFFLPVVQSGWRLDENDNPVPIESGDDGQEQTRYGNVDPTKPVSMREDVERYLKENPWLLLESNGAHATHQQARMAGSVKLTRQQAKDMGVYQKAKAQAEKAGVDLVIE